MGDVLTGGKLLFSLEEAGEALNLSRATLYRLLSRGQLKGLKVGRRTLLAASELERFVAEKMAEAEVR